MEVSNLVLKENFKKVIDSCSFSKVSLKVSLKGNHTRVVYAIVWDFKGGSPPPPSGNVVKKVLS